jgi:hypothetical protein
MKARNLHPVDGCVESGSGVGFGADGVDASVGSAALGLLLDPLVDVFLFEIEGNCAGFPRELETLRYRIDGDDAFGAKQEGAADRKLADRAAAPNRNRLAAFQVTEIGGHVASRENVRKEQHLLVAQAVRNLDRTDIGK